MQNGSMIRTERHGGPDVWEFRWREPGPDGKRKHRSMVSGGVSDVKETAALPVGIVPGLGLAHGSGWLVGQPNLTGLGKGSL